jgi:hypothetical protein
MVFRGWLVRSFGGRSVLLASVGNQVYAVRGRAAGFDFCLVAALRFSSRAATAFLAMLERCLGVSVEFRFLAPMAPCSWKNSRVKFSGILG